MLPDVDGTLVLAPMADATGFTTLAPLGLPVGLALCCIVLILMVAAATSILDFVAALGTLGLTSVWIVLRRRTSEQPVAISAGITDPGRLGRDLCRDLCKTQGPINRSVRPSRPVAARRRAT